MNPFELSLGFLLGIAAHCLLCRAAKAGLFRIVGNRQPAGLLGSNRSGPRHPSTRSKDSTEGGLPTRPSHSYPSGRGNTNDSIALGRLIAILSNPEARRALSPFWQADDMRRQFHRLKRLHSALRGFPEASVSAAQIQVPPKAYPAAAPDHQSSAGSIPSSDSTLPH
jgi:hypothetical protein